MTNVVKKVNGGENVIEIESVSDDDDDNVVECHVVCGREVLLTTMTKKKMKMMMIHDHDYDHDHGKKNDDDGSDYQSMKMWENHRLHGGVTMKWMKRMMMMMTWLLQRE